MLSRVNLSNNKSKQNLSQKLPKYSIKSGKSVNILENKQKNKVESLFKKSKFKKTIIIDGEGNNNLNLNKFRKNHTSHKLHLLNVKDKTKQSILEIPLKSYVYGAIEKRLLSYNYFKIYFPEDSSKIDFEIQCETCILYVNKNETLPTSESHDFEYYSQGKFGVYRISVKSVEQIIFLSL